MMPRRPTGHDDNVPLWLLPQVILQWIKKVGEELDWIHVRRTKSHFYAVRVRTRAAKREFVHRTAAAPAARPAAGGAG